MQMDLYKAVDAVFKLIYFLIFARIVLSLLMVDRYANDITDFIYTVSDIFLKPFRALIPLGGVGLDLSPFFAFIALGIIKEIIINFI